MLTDCWQICILHHHPQLIISNSMNICNTQSLPKKNVFHTYLCLEVWMKSELKQQENSDVTEYWMSKLKFINMASWNWNLLFISPWKFIQSMSDIGKIYSFHLCQSGNLTFRLLRGMLQTLSSWNSWKFYSYSHNLPISKLSMLCSSFSCLFFYILIYSILKYLLKWTSAEQSGYFSNHWWWNCILKC